MALKKKKTLKIILFSLLFLIVAAGIALMYEYNQLQPKNHFKNVPAVGDTNTKTPNNVKEGTFNVVLMGSDERKGENIGHSDSMIIVHVDLNKKEYHALSIPRDTRVHLDGYGYTKLTSVQYIKQATDGVQKGVEASVQSIEELTGIPINYYAETNYGGLQGMVDSIGGINMNVPFDVKLIQAWYPEDKDKIITQGLHKLDGKMVTEIVRQRYSLKNGEYDRQRLQKEALVGIADKVLQPSSISKLPAFVQTIHNFVIATNMSSSDAISFGLAVKGFDPNKVQYHQVDGEWKTMYDDILKNNNDELVIDENQLKQIVNTYFK